MLSLQAKQTLILLAYLVVFLGLILFVAKPDGMPTGLASHLLPTTLPAMAASICIIILFGVILGILMTMIPQAPEDHNR